MAQPVGLPLLQGSGRNISPDLVRGKAVQHTPGRREAPAAATGLPSPVRLAITVIDLCFDLPPERTAAFRSARHDQIRHVRIADDTERAFQKCRADRSEYHIPGSMMV